MELMDRYNRLRHWVFIDNFNTCNSVYKLLSVGTYASGACRKDGLHFPQQLVSTNLQREEA